MATKKNMAVIIATIKSVYPYYAKDGNIEVLAKTWLLLLQDYDDKIINNALLLCMKECEQPPTPAHIIKKIEQMQPKVNQNELWAVYVSALRKINDLEQRFHYTFTDESGVSQGDKAKAKAREIFDTLPQPIKDYVGGSFGEMLRCSRQIDDESLKFEKTRFVKQMPDIVKDNKLRIEMGKINAQIEAKTENKNILKNNA